MNRQQRRSKEVKDDPHPPPNQTPRSPHYQIDVNVHLPADPPWRKENRNKRGVIVAKDPLDLWRGIVFDTLNLIGFAADANLTVGVFLEIINCLPEDMRRAIDKGIVEGYGLRLVTSSDVLEGHIHQKFDALTSEGEKRRVSGLVIPKGVLPDAV